MRNIWNIKEIENKIDKYSKLNNFSKEHKKELIDLLIDIWKIEWHDIGKMYYYIKHNKVTEKQRLDFIKNYFNYLINK